MGIASTRETTPLHSTIMAGKGMVASSQELASFYGAKVLSEGGNVVDAALATSAMLCVTQNNLCGLGGDLFALIKFKGQIFNLNGSGRAADKATISFYRDEMKLNAIPARGPLGAPTVPGIVHAWGELHSKFGTIELKKLLAPAIHYAREGFPITRNYSRSIQASARFLGEYEEWAKIFLPNGSNPETGSLLKQKDLSKTLEQIANEGTSSFYSGSLAEKIARGIEKQGGLIGEQDLKNHTSTWSNPIKTNYRGLDVYETSPNSQAATALLWLNMLENFDLRGKYNLNSEKLLGVLIDTCLKAYSERAKNIGDPETLPLNPNFLSKEFARELLGSTLDASIEPELVTHSGDTTYFTTGDRDGDCLSVIQSNYMGFGSGMVPEGTGFSLHNRGSYFSLDEHHHNALRPRKRTFHTLCASLGVTESGETKFTIGTMGGDVQPQIHIQLMTKVLDYGVDPQAAIDAPRWVVPYTIYEKPSTVYFEPGFETLIPNLKKIVAARGLGLEQFDSLSSQTGHAQMILFQKDHLAGAADPRGDGAAVGF